MPAHELPAVTRSLAPEMPSRAAPPPSSHLTVAGVTRDGSRLLLISESGGEFTVDIDPRLRAALRPEDPADGRADDRAGHGARRMEKTMDSPLRPRDIQARIRSGESPEHVALAAETSIDKIMVYAGPVLAERQHIAERAQRSSMRRKAAEAGSGGSGRTLGDAVEAHLRSVRVDPGTVEWDAWRREDGRWSLVGAFDNDVRRGSAELTFDVPGNFVLLDNDDARWLVGEALPVSSNPSVGEDAPAADDLQARRRRRVAPVDEPLPLGDDAIGMVTDAGPPSGASLDPAPVTDETALRDEAAGNDAQDDDEPTPTGAEPEDPASEEPAARRPVRKSRGRASVPSWDEIMFGGGKQE